jgi:ABC-type Fe3+/spermidine/putrescine transport system ATPase subunit
MATPNEVYHEPATPFVATLVGDSNVVAADAEPDLIQIGSVRLAADTRGHLGPAWAVLRPETVTLVPDGEGVLSGEVVDVAFRGTGFTYRVRVDGVDTPLKVEVAGRHQHDVGDVVHLAWPRQSVRVLPRGVA